MALNHISGKLQKVTAIFIPLVNDAHDHIQYMDAIWSEHVYSHYMSAIWSV